MRRGDEGEERVQFARERPWMVAVTMEASCARIFKRHRAAIRVQKADVAIVNLARIIEATLKLSNKKGFHATSLRELAKASGLSMGGLYSYFDNKATLLSMILHEVGTTAVQVLKAPPDHLTEDPRAHLAWAIDTHIRLSEAMQPWFVFSFMEAKSFPPAERKIAIDAEAATEEIFAEVVARGVASGHFIADEAGLTASLIKPLLQDWYVKRTKYRRRGTSIETYIASVTRFVETALAAELQPLTRAAARR
jgi:TetR/AcrR family transcriptional regulator, cholesterol catabolism regulator